MAVVATREADAPPGWTPREGPRRLRKLGSAGRLAGFHGLVLAVVLGAVVVALVRDFTGSYESLAASSLAAEARSFATAARARPPAEDLHALSIAYLRVHALAAGDVLAISELGAGQVETAGARRVVASPPVAALLAAPPARTVVRSLTITGRPFEIVAVPVTAGASRVGTFLAAADLSPSVAQRSSVLALALAEALVALTAGVASAFLLLRRLLGTIGRITTTADEIGRGRLDRRLGDEGRSDEVGELARTFDAMLERIDTAMTAQRRLLADVSHQLRTPLTIARGHLEILQRTGTGDQAQVDETVELVVDEIDHMRALIERLLLLGRAMEPDFLAPEPVELRVFLADLLDAASVLAPGRAILSNPPDLVLEADAAKLRGALLNLLDNAVRASAGVGPIGLGARLDEDGSLELVVEDAGPGIPVGQREAALRRFSRPGARDADGSGLGLAIAKAVAESHGGRITIERSALGGARVAVVLPRRLVVASR